MPAAIDYKTQEWGRLAMQVDIVGRIRNLQLPVTQPLIPLFECLVNSIEAIEDAGI